MTRIKLCGLSRKEDIAAANRIKPDYIGFVFARESRRYISPERARELKSLLSPGITAVGVFVNESPVTISALLNEGIIDAAQLHGSEGENEIAELKRLSGKPVIQAFRISSAVSLEPVAKSSADLVLLDSGAGTGKVFDWELLSLVRRPYILAGGLSPDNVREAVRLCRPYGVDVSSGIETDGCKDAVKMVKFAEIVRSEALL